MHARNEASLAMTAGLLSFLICFSTGCDRKPAATDPAGPNTSGIPATGEKPAVYIVRGQIEDLPDPSRPTSSFDVHHEAIDNFVKSDGGLGMNSMTMPFPLGPGVSVLGLAIGDIVELTFEVQWKPKAAYRVTKISKLPADTKLEFRAARPPAKN